MSIISSFPLELHCSDKVGCILSSICNWVFNLCKIIIIIIIMEY